MVRKYGQVRPGNQTIMEKALLEDWAVRAIKARIDEGLRLRCINVETTLELVENKRGEQKLELSSTEFNTVPVIHSAMRIENFGSAVTRSVQVLKDTGEEIPCTRFSVAVHARYQGNGAGLFTVSGQVQDRTDHILFFDEDRHEGARDSVCQWDYETA